MFTLTQMMQRSLYEKLGDNLVVSNTLTRDKANLVWEDLVEDYFQHAKRDIEALVASALRTRSLGLRDVLAKGAIRPEVSLSTLKYLVLSGQRLDETHVEDPALLAELGRVVLLQNVLPDDSTYGERLVAAAIALDSKSVPIKATRTLIQYYVVTKNFERAEELLDTFENIDSQHFGYLRGDIKNPFHSEDCKSLDEWLGSFNKVFERHSLEPVTLTADYTLRPFDRLVASQARSQLKANVDEPLVSIVLTAFRPDEQRLMTSIRSIINQSWKNLELIVVDDCSGRSFEGMFQRVADLDSRITVISSRENRGTYAARNIGYAAALGDYITGQDDDDWSHPQRIERQMNYMRQNPEAIGCRVGAIRCDENLLRTRAGHLPHGQNASSLLVRKEGHEAIGGFLEARKAADTEYYLRLTAVTGRTVGDLKIPLSIIRILSDSLSRADFSSGWKHNSRRSFRSAYEYWHRNSSLDQLRVDQEQVPRVAVPERFQIDPTNERRFDFVIAGHWEEEGSLVQSMLEEVRGLLHGNHSVAILNLESASVLRATDQVSLSHEIQCLINDGTVDEIFYDSEVVADVLLFHEPSILGFLPYESSSIKIQRMLILADELPFEADGSDIRYLPVQSHTHAEQSFGVSPIWLPSDRDVRAAVASEIDQDSIHGLNWPGIVNLERWWHNRLYYRSITPVVGCHSFCNYSDVSVDHKIVEQVFPSDGRYDVRLLGYEQRALEFFGKQRVPDAWTLRHPDSIHLSTFLSGLDYYIFLPAYVNVNVPIRAILTALSSGVVVILPKRLELIFGEAALYRDFDEIAETIHHLHSDFSLYHAQLQRTKTHLFKRSSSTSLENIVATLPTRIFT